MNTVLEFNIGLNNNPFSTDLTIELLFELFENYNLKLRVDNGMWRGEGEPTIVGRVECKDCLTHFIHTFKGLTMTLNQDCIAVRGQIGDEVFGELVWSNLYEGEKVEYGDEYFIRFKG